ncbi:MAG TPA: DUF4157 domain-containing protein [Kofleriaceae bacterium]|nr:DUF4157 domain-containing protein [Kofleriaceae bacterium]
MEGSRHRLPPEVLLAIWDRTRAGATDSAGRCDDQAARQQFHELAIRIAARGGRLAPDPGRISRVSVELGGDSPRPPIAEVLQRRVPGRDTLVLVEARRRMAQDEPWQVAQAPQRRVERGGDGLRVSPALLPAIPPPAAHLLRRRADAGEIDPDHPAVRTALGRAGAGAALADELRRPLEARFGFRLGRVRLHTDAVAAAACAALQAHAFTVGEDVFFAAGAWSPATATGLRLLTHEVAHVVQGYQGRVPSAASPAVSDPADALEREAEAEAARAPASTAGTAPREAPPLAAEGVLHRAAITLRNGHRVTDVTPGAADNKREDVLALLERLRLLGTMDDDFFLTTTQIATAVAGITALSAGAPVTAAADLGVVAQLIDWNDSGFLPPSAVQHYMGIAVTAPVGHNAIGTSNRKDELLLVIDRLNFLGLHSSFTADRAAVAAITTPTVTITQIPTGTYDALRAFRRGVAAGTLGWQSVRGNERENDADRFAGQTASVEVSVLVNHPTVLGVNVPDATENVQVSVFLPRNLGADNKVFVFFSPGNGTEENPAFPGGNATNVHGLRAPADDSGWILIGVPGWGDPSTFGERGWTTINTAAIQACLARAGRSTTITVTRFAAHSRGGRGMERTLARGLVAPAPAQVTRLEAPGGHGHSRNRPVASEDIRAIGYARLIQDRTDVPAPAGAMALIAPLLADLPARGQFTTHTGATAAGRVNMQQWVNHHRAHLDAIKAVDDPAEREWNRWLRASQTTQLNHAIVDPSPYFFVNTQDLMRFFGGPLINAAGQPVAAGFSQGIYAHHLYVAEIAHELFE